MQICLCLISIINLEVVMQNEEIRVTLTMSITTRPKISRSFSIRIAIATRRFHLDTTTSNVTEEEKDRSC